MTVDGVPFETGQASDGTIFVVSSPGRPGPQWVTALDPAKNRVTIRYDLDGIWTEGQVGLSVVHGALWLGNWTTNSVYRIDLPIHPHE